MIDREQLQERLLKLRPLLPWGSLMMGLGGAVLLDRRPERAWVVVVALVVGWLLVLVYGVVRHATPSSKLGKLGVAGVQMGTQSMLQLALFFVTPFYLRASNGLGHYVFDAGLIVACALTLWDPLFFGLLSRRYARAFLLAFGTFVGLNLALPILGLSNQTGMITAALVSVVGLPWIEHEQGERIRASVWLVGGLAPLLLFLLGTWVPPAPLQAKRIALGTRLQGYELEDPTGRLELVPQQLICGSVIAAPRGLNDVLFHVWSKDGEVRDRIRLKIQGGRPSGFRTWSIKRNLGKSAEGRWRCVVQTERGQFLGEAELLIERPIH